MSHLGDRVAEFVFGEMTAPEAHAATEHLQQCRQCSLEVERFSRTHQLLKAVPEADLPRPVLFALEPKQASPSFVWRWLPPIASAVAASILTALFLNPAPAAVPVQPDYENLVVEVQQLRGELEYLGKVQRRDARETSVVLQQIAQRSAGE